MKQLIIAITVMMAFHVSNVEAVRWVTLDEAEGLKKARTNMGEEGKVICSTSSGDLRGIGGDGRRLGFLTPTGCKTVDGMSTKKDPRVQLAEFGEEEANIMVLVDDGDCGGSDEASEAGREVIKSCENGKTYLMYMTCMKPYMVEGKSTKLREGMHIVCSKVSQEGCYLD